MKHHFIPQFYLRPWLGSDHKLEEFGRVPPTNQIRSRRRGTKSTGYEEDLYVIPDATEETKHNVEKVFMGVVDASAANARDLLLEGVIPQDELRVAWARFLLSLMMRTPEQIAEFKRRISEFWFNPDADLLARYAEARQSGWPETLQEYLDGNKKVPERIAVMLATDMMQREKLLRLLMGAIWRVMGTGTKIRPLITSDRPLAMTNGLMRPDGHFGLPIGPRHLFVGFMQKDFAEAFCSQPVGKIIRLTNDAVVGQARKNVYAIDATYIADVRRRMSQREYIQLVPTEENGRKPKP
ncbi:DUF4238 domain-containing protein [Pararhizobium antarcticum]|uniref:DUF4238 domain-containing protein n=1 Tax=Pararhizobium antarcticum TaxID=1798805 RepID=A0A657LVM8_9HYPH|nr:DUF4238 domain-containing protein [Pararhizobium antarcticum]OJF92861.1 hypothetical protein AX761_20690 [Rhizobium sp. 58]OJF98756.1 hypothetical protein AX760_01600 [Pararhizobium antarcticum]OJF98856.1 hypothetical protein AX760_02210 [Pararhizobium antarcticum]